MTIYAHVTNGTVDQVGTPPATAYAEGRWWDLRSLDPALLAKAGWVEATTTARPADTATETSDMSWTLTGGKAVQAWTVRAKTQAELDTTIRQAARTKIVDDLVAGTAAIVAAKKAATDDVAVATAAKTAADALSAQVAARKTTVDSSTPAATLAYITAMRGEVSYLLAQTKAIIDAISQIQGWRKAVDENAITTDNALVWLAKHTTGDVLASETAERR